MFVQTLGNVILLAARWENRGGTAACDVVWVCIGGGRAVVRSVCSKKKNIWACWVWGCIYFKELFLRSFPNFTHLLQEQFPVLVEEENAEGSMENPSGRARHKPMRQVFVHMAHNLIVLVQRYHLRVLDQCDRDIEDNTLGNTHTKG